MWPKRTSPTYFNMSLVGWHESCPVHRISGAPSYAFFVLGRCLQGIASSNCMVILAMMRDAFQKEEERLKVPCNLWKFLKVILLLFPYSFFCVWSGWRGCLYRVLQDVFFSFVTFNVIDMLLPSDCFLFRFDSTSLKNPTRFLRSWNSFYILFKKKKKKKTHTFFSLFFGMKFLVSPVTPSDRRPGLGASLCFGAAGSTHRSAHRRFHRLEALEGRLIRRLYRR